MYRYLILFISLTFIKLFSQDETQRCAAHIFEEQLIKKDYRIKDRFEQSIKKAILNRKLFRTADYEVVTIPVVVHIVHNNLPLGTKLNLKDEVIISQIKALNEDFGRFNEDTGKTLSIFKSVAADTKIRFCLAQTDPFCNITSGILRVVTTKATYGIYELNNLKSLSSWPSDQYLNIWITDIEDPYLGFAMMPYGTMLEGLEEGNYNTEPRFDGVVIDYKAFGTEGASLHKVYNKGRTTTHEIGHWLGLRHIWGDESCGNDYCDDTPTQNQSTIGCIRREDCVSNNFAMMENYMDYTYDECMNLFTKDQTDRMRAVLEQSDRRRKLVENNLCSKTPDPSYRPDFESFEGIIQEHMVLGDSAAITHTGAYEASSHSLNLSQKNSGVLFETKKLSLSNPQLKYLNFDVAALNNNSTMPTGSLVINYSSGCVDDWKRFSTFPISQLISAGNGNTTVPNKDSWSNKNINIGLINLDYIKLQFKYENNGNLTNDVSLFIDNVLFSDTKESNMEVYFDYLNHELVLDPKFIGTQNLEVNIYNINGQIIYQKIFDKITLQRISIENIANPNQLYFVKATLDQKPYYCKFAYLKQ